MSPTSYQTAPPRSLIVTNMFCSGQTAKPDCGIGTVSRALDRTTGAFGVLFLGAALGGFALRETVVAECRPAAGVDAFEKDPHVHRKVEAAAYPGSVSQRCSLDYAFHGAQLSEKTPPQPDRFYKLKLDASDLKMRFNPGTQISKAA